MEITPVNPSGAPLKLLILVSVIVIFLLVTVLAFFSAQSAARDQIRVGDINLIGQYLTAYKNNQGYYPLSNSQNQPVDWGDYLEALPQPPLPADGSCTESQNQFLYSTFNSQQDFKLSFCLGSKTGNFPAGLNNLTPSK